MNIQTVVDNLQNTIQGKRALLITLQDPGVGEYHQLVRYAMTHQLTSNIGELERILADVQQCLTPGGN
jgi:hypothetical protein